MLDYFPNLRLYSTKKDPVTCEWKVTSRPIPVWTREELDAAAGPIGRQKRALLQVIEDNKTLNLDK